MGGLEAGALLFFALARSQGAEVLHQLFDVAVGEVIAEGGHARSPDRRPAVLDDVEEVAIGLAAHALGEVAGLQQEESSAPRAPAIASVALDAVGVEEALAARGPGRRARVAEQPRQAPGEEADAEQGGSQDDEGAAHRKGNTP